jgi:hypothetical protein
VGTRVGVKSCGKEKTFCPHRDSIPVSSSLQPFAVPTELCVSSFATNWEKRNCQYWTSSERKACSSYMPVDFYDI